MQAHNTFSLKNTRYEAPRDLRSRKVQVRFDRQKFDRAIVYFKGERMGEARPGRLRRQRPEAQPGGGLMFRSHFGVAQNPFSGDDVALLPHQ